MIRSTVFVGRTSELLKLHQLLDRAIKEKKIQVAFISGEAGTGKTTLIERLILEARQKFPNLLVTQGKCTTENEMEGLAPFIQILDGLYEFSKKEKKWWEQLRANPWFDFFKEVAPAWLDIVTGGIVTAAKTTLEEGQKVLQTRPSGASSLFGQFVKLIEEKGEDRPLILFIDDMQWADSSSIDLLFYLSRHLHHTPVLLAIAYRSSEISSDKNEFETIRNNIIRYGGTEIPDLTEGIDVKAYSNQRFPNHSFPSDFLDSIQEKTDGYPLFVQQVFDWLLEKHLIHPRQRNGKQEWLLEANELAQIEIPESVQAAIDNRIQQLNSHLANTLAFASVEGEEFTAQVVSEIQDLPELEILEHLEDLERKFYLVRFLREISLGDKTISIYRFTHGFYREHIYHNLSPTRRRVLHSKVAYALESLYDQHHELIGSSLAMQFEQARHLQKAFHYYVMSAKEVYKRYAWQESVALAKSAYMISRDLPENNENFSKLIESVLVWEACCERLGSYEEIIPVLEDTIQAASNASTLQNQQVSLAKLLIGLGWTQYYKSDYVAEITAKKALNIAKQLNDLEITYEAQALLSDVLVDELGKFEQGKRIQIDQLQIARALNDFVKEADVLSLISWCESHIGLYAESITASRESLDLIASHQIDDPILLAFAYRCLGYGLQAQGNSQAGIQVLNEALLIYKRLNDQVRSNWCQAEIAEAYFIQGNFAEAENLFQASTISSEFVGDFQQAAWNYTWLGRISIKQGKIIEAENWLKKAEQALSTYSCIIDSIFFNDAFMKLCITKKDLEQASQIKDATLPLLDSIESIATEISLYNTFGELSRAEGDFEKAIEWFKTSLHLSQQTCDILRIADSYHLLGAVYQELNETVLAQSYFSSALQIYKAYKHDFRIQQHDKFLPPLEYSEDFEDIRAIVNPKYANPLKLSKPYTCRLGNPTIQYVDSAIFIKKYFVNCMSCQFCHDSCCNYGVDVDIENVARISEHREALEKIVGIPYSLWFLPDVQPEVDYPGSQFVRTRVMDGACVFLNRDRRGCYLHQHCLENGLDYHELKPIISCLFPLTFDKGLLHPATEIYTESLICFASGPTLYQGLREELLYYFGEEFVLELDKLEATICPEPKTTGLLHLSRSA